MSCNSHPSRHHVAPAVALALLMGAVSAGTAQAEDSGTEVLNASGDAIGQIASLHTDSHQPTSLSEFLATDISAADAGSTSVATSDDDLDWTLLDQSTFSPSANAAKPRRLRRHVPMISGNDTAWSSALNRIEGSQALSIGQPLPFAQSKVGIDMTLARPGMRIDTLPLPEKLASEARRHNSDGSAWASATLGGVGDLWDKTDLESRLDPLHANGSVAARFSRSVAVDAETGSKLTFHGSYRLSAPIGAEGERYSEIDQAARLVMPGGTSFLVGQSRSTTDDRWLARAGAEQTIAGGVRLSGMVAEAADGKPAMSLTAAYRQSW